MVQEVINLWIAKSVAAFSFPSTFWSFFFSFWLEQVGRIKKKKNEAHI